MMRQLVVEVLEGQDLLRSPDDRCKDPTASPDYSGVISSVASNSQSSTAPKLKKWAAVRMFAEKMKSPSKTIGKDGSFKKPPDVRMKRAQEGKPFIELRLWDQVFCTSEGPESSKRCVFNEKFRFDIVVGDEESEDFQLEIFVRDSLKSKNYGSVHIPLDRLAKASTTKQWYQLARPEWEEDMDDCDDDAKLIPDTGGRKDTCGLIFLSLHFENKEIEEVIETTELQTLVAPSEDDCPSVHMKTLQNTVRKIPVRLADYVILAERSTVKKTVDTCGRRISYRYPEKDHVDLPLPTMIEWFIFAFEQESQKMKIHETSETELFSFVFAPRGVALYGYCLVYPDLDNSTHRCLCIVSRLNCGDMFYDCLRDIYAHMTLCDDPKEVVITAAASLVEKIPMPLPGLLDVKFSLFEDSSELFQCSLGKMGRVPPLTFRHGLEFLINELGINALLDLWNALLLEYRILLHSSERWKLSLATETLRTLLYPFRWHHAYIAMLPLQLLECVQSPMPYLIGLESKSMSYIFEQDLTDVVVMDLDAGVFDKYDNVEPMPKSEYNRLRRMIYHIMDCDVNRLDDPECDNIDPSKIVLSTDMVRKIQYCFLEYVCTILRGYRECLFFLNDSMPVFNSPKFLRSRESAQDYLSRLLETQGFEYFKQIHRSITLTDFHCYYMVVTLRLSDYDQIAAWRGKRTTDDMMIDDESFDHPATSIEEHRSMIWTASEKRWKRHRDSKGWEPVELEYNEMEDMQRNLKEHFEYSSFVSDHSDDLDALNVESIAEQAHVTPKFVRFAIKFLERTVGTENFTRNDDSEYENMLPQYGSGTEDDFYELDVDSQFFITNRDAAPSESDSNRRTQSIDAMQRSNRDRKVELVLQECIAKIFLNQAVDAKLIKSCEEQFLASQHARDLFGLILVQPYHRNNVSHGGSAGRGLNSLAFKCLSKLCRSFLNACYKKEDFTNARNMLELSQSYYLDKQSLSNRDLLSGTVRGQEESKTHGSSSHMIYDDLWHGRVTQTVPDENYLVNQLQNLPIWNMLLFWEDWFAVGYGTFTPPSPVKTLGSSVDQHVKNMVSLSSDTKLTLTDSHARLRKLSSHDSFASLNKSMSDLRSPGPGDTSPSKFSSKFGFTSSNDASNPEHYEKARQDVMFELTLNMVHQMLRLGTSPDKARALVERIVSVYGLHREHEETLTQLIANVNNSLTVERNSIPP